MKKQITITLSLLTYLILGGHLAFAQTVSVKEVWTLSEGLNKPESVVYDKTNKVLYVSNINGKGREKNGLGYISKVSLDGKLIKQEWIKGLNAPKGLALRDGKLYVSDIDTLVVVDVKSEKVIKSYPTEGGKFFNDVTIDKQGKVYVSDSKTSKIHVLDGENFSVWLDDPRVRKANGLYAMKDHIIIAAGDSDNKKPHKNRYLQVVSYDGKSINPFSDKTGLGGLDGVEPDSKGGFFLTDWSAGKFMHYNKAKGLQLIKQLGKGTADLEYVSEENIVYLPVMVSHELKAYSVSLSK